MDLNTWIARIRNRDPMTFEDAYWGERPSGPDVVPRLIFELQQSTDGYTRGKFAELLGESGDEAVVPYLIAELSHSAPEVRQWAVLALEQLGFAEGVLAAKCHRESHPQDFA